MKTFTSELSKYDRQFLMGRYLAFETSLTYGQLLAELNREEFSFQKIQAHHITLCFSLTPENIQSLDHWLFMMNDIKGLDDLEFTAVGHVLASDIEMLTVTVDKEHRYMQRNDGSIFHMTLSHEPQRSPVTSNHILMACRKTFDNFMMDDDRFTKELSIGLRWHDVEKYVRIPGKLALFNKSNKDDVTYV